ncbi:MAG: FtsX-like permease family protein [Luteitalea sp.]|nr:FtsX-like permease family protein [Luteitalea sp.]
MRYRVALVNEAFARRYFGEQGAVGKRFGWGNPPNVSYGIEIVGVARNAVYGDLREDTKPLIYFPTSSGQYLIVRAARDLAGLTATLRREIQTLDRNLAVVGIRAVSDSIERMLVREKLLAKLSTFFGVLAGLLAAVGLYGLMAYRVVGRTREIGIRMAIGAQRASVLRAEMQSALLIVALGIVLGAPAALAAGRLLNTQLFGVAATDPAMLGVATTLLVLVSSVAAYLPARRASRVDPTAALRDE